MTSSVINKFSCKLWSYLECFRKPFVLTQASQVSCIPEKVAMERNTEMILSGSKYPISVLGSHRLRKLGDLVSPLHPPAPHVKIQVPFSLLLSFRTGSLQLTYWPWEIWLFQPAISQKVSVLKLRQAKAPISKPTGFKPAVRLWLLTQSQRITQAGGYPGDLWSSLLSKWGQSWRAQNLNKGQREAAALLHRATKGVSGQAGKRWEEVWSELDVYSWKLLTGFSGTGN